MNSLNRRDALKSGLFGAAAAAGTMLGAGAAEAKPASQAKDYKFDFVVVGAGCAGLSAALEAADQGATVAVLKNGHAFWQYDLRGRHLQRHEHLRPEGTGAYRHGRRLLRRHDEGLSQGRGDPQLTRVYADESAGAVQWAS